MNNLTHSKTEHFHRIINTLKAINKIMVDEKKIDALIRKTCQVLTQTRGYCSCWIGLFDKDDKLHHFESSGLLKDLDTLKKNLQNGIIPKKIEQAIKKQEFIQVDSRDKECPIGKPNSDYTTFVAPITINAEQYGIMCAAVPHTDAQHPKEADNYNDIAKNIGFAINSLQEKNDLAWLLATSTDGIITFNRELKALMVNQRFCELFNCQQEDIIGKNIPLLVQNNLNKKESQNIYAALKQITQGQELKDTEFIFNKKILRVETQINELKNYRIVRIQDITKERKEKDDIKQSETKYKNLVEGLNDALFILQDKLVKYANPALCKMTGYCEKELLNKPFIQLVAQLERNKVSKIHSKRLNGEQVKNTYQSIAINKQGKEVPVEVTVIPVEFEKRSAYQVILHNITARQATRQKLKESEERYRFLSESGFEGILIHKNGVIIDVNEAMIKQSGYTREEIVGENIFKFLNSETEVRDINKHILSKNKSPIITKAITKSGKLAYVEVESKDIKYHGEEVTIAGIKNITERQQLTQKLRDTKNRMNNQLNNLPGMAYTCYNNKNWEMQFLSEGCIALTGYSPNELLNNNKLSYGNIIHTAHQKEVWDKVQEAIKSNKSFELEYKIICKNKQEKWVWERGRKTIQNNREVLEGFISDITERKKATKAFIQSQTKYRTLFNAINDAVIIQDYEKEDQPIVEINQWACQLYGYNREELLQKTIKDLSVSYNEDLENNTAQIFETTHKKANGTIIPVEVSSSIFQIGKERMVMSMIRDISRRKEAENRLSDSEHLLDTILQSMPSGFVMIDKDYRIRRVNEQTCQITGYRREELEGQKCDLLCPKGQKSRQCPILEDGLDSFTGLDTFIKCNGDSQTAILKNVQTIIIDGKKYILESFQDITQWKVTEQQLIKAKTLAQQSEQRFSAFMNFLPGSAFIKDQNLNFQYVNRFMERNMNATDWIGKNTKEVIPPAILKNVIKDDEKAFLQGRHKYEEIFPVIGRGMRDFLTYKFTIGEDKKQLGGISIDITERKRLEGKNTMLSQAIEASPVSVVITDINGNIEYVNPFFEEKTGYTLQEAIGKNPRILQSGKKSKRFYSNMWETILKGKIWRGEFHNKKKNGVEYWEKGIISPVTNESGEIAHFIAIKEDITHQKQLLSDLKRAKEKAEESDNLKSAFLANMSHEIRTPMNGIMGFTELLKDPSLNGEQQKEFIAIIQKSGDRMLSTINDIIDISKIESNLVTVDLSTFELKFFLSEIRLFFEPEIKKKQLYIDFINAQDPDSPMIKSDPTKLNSILTNLIKNAIKFTKTGGITFGYQFINESVEFFVKDTGIGIPPDRQNAIFDRFVQADIADSRVYEGSGLGLAISKSYTEMLGGSIRLESEQNKGTTFYITLPYKKPDHETLKMEEMLTKPEELPGNLKILIAEDDPISVELLKIILHDKSKQILIAENGKTAVELVKENPDIDLVMMDIKMPVMDGFEATEKIRDFNKEIIIIAQTAFAQEQDALKAFESGCNNYITKPINANDLFAMIKEMFSS